MAEINTTSANARPDIQGADDGEPLGRFIEQMGLMYESDNLPRIAGRVLGLLLVEDGPYSLRELADRLQVSRASVSTNARILTEIGVVDRVAKPGDRQDYYQLSRSPFHQLLTGKVRAMNQARAFFSEAAESFPADRGPAKHRLCKLAEFYGAAAACVTELIERSIQKQ